MANNYSCSSSNSSFAANSHGRCNVKVFSGRRSNQSLRVSATRAPSARLNIMTIAWGATVAWRRKIGHSEGKVKLRFDLLHELATTETDCAVSSQRDGTILSAAVAQQRAVACQMRSVAHQQWNAEGWRVKSEEWRECNATLRNKRNTRWALFSVWCWARKRWPEVITVTGHRWRRPSAAAALSEWCNLLRIYDSDRWQFLFPDCTVADNGRSNTNKTIKKQIAPRSLTLLLLLLLFLNWASGAVPKAAKWSPVSHCSLTSPFYGDPRAKRTKS